MNVLDGTWKRSASSVTVPTILEEKSKKKKNKQTNKQTKNSKRRVGTEKPSTKEKIIKVAAKKERRQQKNKTSFSGK